MEDDLKANSELFRKVRNFKVIKSPTTQIKQQYNKQLKLLEKSNNLFDAANTFENENNFDFQLQEKQIQSHQIIGKPQIFLDLITQRNLKESPRKTLTQQQKAESYRQKRSLDLKQHIVTQPNTTRAHLKKKIITLTLKQKLDKQFGVVDEYGRRNYFQCVKQKILTQTEFDNNYKKKSFLYKHISQFRDKRNLQNFLSQTQKNYQEQLFKFRFGQRTWISTLRSDTHITNNGLLTDKQIEKIDNEYYTNQLLKKNQKPRLCESFKAIDYLNPKLDKTFKNYLEKYLQKNVAYHKIQLDQPRFFRNKAGTSIQIRTQ